MKMNEILVKIKKKYVEIKKDQMKTFWKSLKINENRMATIENQRKPMTFNVFSIRNQQSLYQHQRKSYENLKKVYE